MKPVKLDKKGRIIVTEAMTLKQVRSYLKALGVFHWRNHQSLASFKGLPDLEGVHRKQHFYIEVKAPKGKLSEHQEKFIKTVMNEGERVFVAFGFDGFRMEFDCWRKEKA